MMELLSEVTLACCSPFMRSSTLIWFVCRLSKVSRGCCRIGVLEHRGSSDLSSWPSDVLSDENVMLLSKLEGEVLMTL